MTILDTDLVDTTERGNSILTCVSGNSQHLFEKHYHRKSTLAYLYPAALHPKMQIKLDFNLASQMGLEQKGDICT